MLMLNALEQVDRKCYCLLDTGANALVLPRRDGMMGTDAPCTVPGGSIVQDLLDPLHVDLLILLAQVVILWNWALWI